MGRFVEAIEDYSRAIDLDEFWITPYISRGRTFRSIGKDKEAEQDFDTALSMDPDSQEEELLERCYVQMERENYEDAIEDARRVIWKDSTFIECYVVTGLAFTKMGQLENAAEEYTKAMENSDVPEHPRFLNLRAEIYDRLNRPADAKNDRRIAMSIANVMI